jgi:GT2 family glycosyltransferase
MPTQEAYLISIITINYNGLKDTCELLDTLPLDDASIEVIVVDNASREDEASVIEQRYPQVKVLRSKENLGFAGGNNLGIEAASGKYLYFINNDTLLHLPDELVRKSHFGMPAAFRYLVQRFESDPKIGIVCPKIRFTWGQNLIQYAGFTPLSRITLRNHAIGYNESDFGQYDVPHPTPYAHGAAMMVSRAAIEKAGPMPTCFFLYYEELDWSMMIRRAGFDIWYEPASVIYHKESQTTGQASPLRTYYITRNRLLLVRRNSSLPWRYLSYLYLIFVAGSKNIFKSLLDRRPDLAKATLKGIWHFIKN